MSDLRDEIIEIILNHRYIREPRDNEALKYSSMLMADKILELIKPELEKARILNDKIGHVVASDIAVLVEKARKWDRVKEVAEYDDCILCFRFEQCQRDIVTSNHIAPCYFEIVVDTIEGEKE